MKIKLISPWIGCGLLGLMLAAPLAVEAQPGFYLKADLGGNITQKTDLHEFLGPVEPGSKVKFDPGYRIGIAAGYEICQFVAVEGEVGALANNIRSITAADRVDAAFMNIPFLVNLKLQAPRNWVFRPYVGGGAGGAASTLAVDHIDLNGSEIRHGSQADAVFAYQGFAGFRVAINQQMGIGFEYRYFAAEAPTWNAEFDDGSDAGNIKFGRARTHAFSVVFDWHF